jgi:hypothetical protein
MREEREKQLLSELDRLAFIASGIAIAILASLYFVVGLQVQSANPFLLVAREFVLAIITDLIPILIIFLISYTLFRRIQTIKAEQQTSDLAVQIAQEIRATLSRDFLVGSPPDSAYYEEFDHVPWDDLIRTSSTMDICVHYFDTWINLHTKSLQDFFDHGGRVRIILPNPKNETLVGVIKQRFPEYDEEQVRTKIAYTHNRLALILEKATHRDARLETYYIDEFILYCGVRFDRRVLVLSPFEHIREMKVAAPATMISLGKFESSQRWFEKEFSGLMAKATNSHILNGRSH